MRVNQIVVAGNLVRDPELTYTNSGKAICKFTVAVNENNDEVSFIDVVAWEKTAETCSQYLHKGSGALVVGRIKQDRWKDKETDANRSKVYVVAFNVQFYGKGKSQDNEYTNDDDLPFS